mmetsp:Transcript_2729/g.3501  ORF Transcript_2729/g.3501 Transcript_2729/m.3501 type:complete len:139 (+) Transcript_2729:281-697(+)|eukprot:CAMPEP_0117764418 /NCGR_PEP_ID=MMETSP0947-20121206/19366_1 /TAXON_ID=44440 /ORGANISM="Chattonella subsalsa, Strain CCMP2191" /LENGTH=138 /DNA_ID=CAMNT_0005586601 /DNA_START=265 /DNA_END=681 /DNA_ORIENTATION=+
MVPFSSHIAQATQHIDSISEGIYWLRQHPVLAAVVWIFGPTANDAYYKHLEEGSVPFELDHVDGPAIRRNKSILKELNNEMLASENSTQKRLEPMKAVVNEAILRDISPNWGWYIYISPEHNHYVERRRNRHRRTGHT